MSLAWWGRIILISQKRAGVNTRYINNIAMEDLDICDSLLVTEVLLPLGTGHLTEP